MDKKLTEIMLNTVKNSEDIVNVCASYMSEHYMQDITMEELADVSNITCCHFIRLFSSKMGISPYQFLLNRRIEVSKSMLTDTDMSIVKIAESVGFFSSKSLIRNFKKVTGMTPSEYRRIQAV